MRIIGLATGCRDSAAALIEDGRVAAAAQEERFSRAKHEPGFPRHALDYCLTQAGCTLAELDLLAFHGDRDQSLAAGRDDRVLVVEHALSHAAAAFFPSPFRDAAVLVLDRMGAALGQGDGNHLELRRNLAFPHALGLLYSAVTRYIGFKAGSGEYKVMGLAPYGAPLHVATLRDHLIEIDEDGDFRLNLDYFGPEGELAPTVRRLAALFGRPPRRPDRDPLTRFHMDIAASVQTVTEQAVLALAGAARRETGARRLCLAGDVALNCVANGKIARAGLFDSLWIQPAAGDGGGALGAALAAYHLHRGQARVVRGDGRDAMAGALLGPSWTQPEIEARLTAVGARFQVLGDAEMIERTAQALAAGQAVGWVQGRMEFGPRALGARSILADPRSPAMQRQLNLKVKFRESFRPFAPAVLAEDAADWFELDGSSPYMLLVAPVRQDHRCAMTAAEGALSGIDRLNVARSSLPAVTHVDYSARIQTVEAGTHPRFHALLSAFKALTGCGVLVNTSFNVRGEPIVCTPEDAFRCFLGSGIEALAVGNCFLAKEDQEQNPALARDHRNAFAPD